MKLKPCPSCGYSDFEEIGKYTECTYCNCRMPTHQWNTRHYPQEITDVIEAAKTFISRFGMLSMTRNLGHALNRLEDIEK